MNKLKDILSVAIYDIRIAVTHAYYQTRFYLKNLALALIGQSQKEIRALRLEFTQQIIKLLAENAALRDEVSRLNKKTAKKTATVAQKKPVKKKTSGK